MFRRIFSLLVFLLVLPSWTHGASYPPPTEGDFVIPHFTFEDGEVLPELRLHYHTLGQATRDVTGRVQNAVLIMHGTGGSGRQFLTENFGGVLFGPGQLLDATKYFIILPDDIGAGQSSKPSDGLHGHFPHYDYHDMVRAEYQLVTQGLHVNHLRLVTGTSMGGMHTWMWGELYPDFMDALMPLASLPVQISGRNRVLRDMAMTAIRTDPEWNNGDYKAQPRGLICSTYILLIMTSSPLEWQKEAPTQQEADAFFQRMMGTRLAHADANDTLYQWDASRDYNPRPDLEKIQAPLLAINSADDQVNPPELGIMEKEIKRVRRGRFILLPITDQTRGHGTHSLPKVWQGYLKTFLEETNRPVNSEKSGLGE